MAKRGSNNSIIFLTTLGVYLGLVLVGATPVLGHAATTRHFELRDEIEITDDLDRNPDDERDPLELSIGNYYADLEYLISRLERLSREGKFDIYADTFDVSQSTALPCVAGNKVGSYTAERFDASGPSLRPILESMTKRVTDGYGFADCVASNAFLGQEATHSKFVLKLTADGLSLEVSGVKRSNAEAHAYLNDLTAAWEQFRKTEKVPAAKYISDGTVLSVNGSKILVVTRLPRAALAALFNKDAK